MRHFKALVLTVCAVLLTGCYTQLQYSKTTQKDVDEQEENVSGYSWTDDDNNGETADTYEQDEEAVNADQQHSQDNYTIVYKDYEYAQKWEECGCNPYKVYNFYGSSFDSYGYGYYPFAPHRSYLIISPHYNPWRFHHNFYGPRHYYGSRFGIGSSWGYSHFGHYYDPYFGSPYAYSGYWGWGHHSNFVFTNFYGSSVYYNDGSQDVNKNTRYGRRSIGTDRVNVDRNRGNSGGTVRGRQSTVSSGEATVRTRSSVGTSRTRNRGTVRNRKSSGSNSRGTVRSRGDRGNDDNRSSQRIHYRSVSGSDLDNVDTQQQRSRTFRNVAIDTREKESRTFFNRIKGFFKRSAKSFTSGSGSHSTFRSSTRSSSSTTTTRSRSTVGSNTSNHSSVGSSRSSSSNSRSRGSSSSGSRSRSGGSDGGSSSSDRSRDN